MTRVLVEQPLSQPGSVKKAKLVVPPDFSFPPGTHVLIPPLAQYLQGPLVQGQLVFLQWYTAVLYVGISLTESIFLTPDYAFDALVIICWFDTEILTS